MNVQRGTRFSQIGLDRLVRLDWLELAADLALAGVGAVDAKSELQRQLKPWFRSSDVSVRGSIDKTITVLRKVWLNPPTPLRDLQWEGLDLLRESAKHNHIAIHWGMVMAVYPFWASTAAQVGRLLRLQGKVAATHVQRRLKEQYGERETVHRRARYVIRSFLHWGVLTESGVKGTYGATKPAVIDDGQLITWLIEASLHSRQSGSAHLRDLLTSPVLFPFQISPVNKAALAARSQCLQVVRYNLEEDFLVLGKPTTWRDTA